MLQRNRHSFALRKVFQSDTLPAQRFGQLADLPQRLRGDFGIRLRSARTMQLARDSAASCHGFPLRSGTFARPSVSSIKSVDGVIKSGEIERMGQGGSPARRQVFERNRRFLQDAGRLAALPAPCEIPRKTYHCHLIVLPERTIEQGGNGALASRIRSWAA